MRIKWQYTLYIGLLHVWLGLLAYWLLKEAVAWLLLVELGLLISMGFSYALYRKFTRPLRLLGNGIDAIKDQDFAIHLRPTGSPEMDCLVKVYNQMLKHIREERRQVQEQHFFLDRLIQASPAGIILLDYDGHIAEINPMAMEVLGLETAPIGQKLEDMAHPLLRELAQWPAGQSGVLSGKGQERYRCEVAQFIHRGFQRKFLMIQELSKEILATEKRAYGKVIRMMAHEVNNSIGAINSILQSTIEAYPEVPDDELAQDIRTSLEVAYQRNERLNQFMRNFAEVVRLPEPNRVWVDANATLQRVQQLMLPMAQKQNTRLELLVPGQPVRLEIDEEQIEQALVNMIKNALESLEQGGTVQLKLSVNPVQIVVADDGPGLPPEAEQEWMVPFYSNKPGGQGIGLTLIKEIARQHDGRCELETLANGWTECRIRFEAPRKP
jgi:nitrogen fixation/metabolism regulation signal transduction histidine kinase